MAESVSYLLILKDRINKVLKKAKRNFDSLTNSIGRSQAVLSSFKNRMVSLGSKIGKVSEKLRKFGTGTLLKSAIIAGISLKVFTNFEEALFNVAKTANIKVGPQLDAMGDKIIKMSEKLGLSSKKLASFTAVAAQLGVKGEKNLLLFTEVLGKLEKTTNIVGEEGAAQLARLINVVGESKDKVQNFASALVELGNNSAATEAEILRFATDLASRTSIFDLTGQQVLGMAAAFKSVGIQSELASSAIGRNLGNISKAISTGGDKLKVLSFVTGQNREQLKKAFAKDSLSVLLKFGEGLNRLKKSGFDLNVIMQAFGAEGIRDATILGTLAKKSELIKEKILLSNKAFKENNALNKEFAVRMQSVGAQIDILKAKFGNFIIETVMEYRDEIKGAIEITKKLFNFLRENKQLVKFLVVVGAIVTAVAAISLVLGVLLTPLGAVVALMSSLVLLWERGKEFFNKLDFGQLVIGHSFENNQNNPTTTSPGNNSKNSIDGDITIRAEKGTSVVSSFFTGAVMGKVVP